MVAANLHRDMEWQFGDYQQTRGIELTVMGAFGQHRLKELLFGGVTRRMLVNSKMPLLLLR